MVLPLLVVLAIGFSDFGAAFRLKQRLTNGAREGARIAINQRTIDLTQNVPKSVQSVRASVQNNGQGQDILNTLTTPFQIIGGTSNPNPVLVGQVISSSDSIITIPLYDGHEL